MINPENENNADEAADQKSADEEILRIARERYTLGREAWDPIYKLAKEDLEFLAGEQWPEEVINARKQQNRPCLTNNRLPQYVHQITNDQRQNRPSIKVSPVDDLADIEVAKKIQGLVRHTELKTNADAARDKAFECAVQGGIGFYRIRTGYTSPTSFNIEAIYDRIPDPFMVTIDPFYRDADSGDKKWGFIEEDIPKEDYKKQYGETKLGSSHDWSSHVETSEGWITANSCRVAEYFTIDYESDVLLQLSNGQVIKQSEISEMGLPPEIYIVDQRQVQVPVINHYKINGSEIIERTRFPGSIIPIIPVFGKEIIINGKRILEGAIRHAKDDQRMLNFMKSSEAEAIALAPKAPFIAAIGQIPPELEQMWKTANTMPQSLLLYEPTAVNGTVLPPPQRNTVEPAVMAITQARQMAAEDIKAAIGIYDATLGNKSNENSGIAIQRRNAQAQTSNFHFIDNLTRAIRLDGKILVGIFPEIYDAPMVSRIIGEEGQEEIVKLNQPFTENGVEKIYRLDVGQYDVAVETGPSFATKRQEAQSMMMEFMKVVPQKADLIADLVAKYADWTGGQEIHERLKKILPPELQEGKNDKPIPPQVQAQIQQMTQMVEQLTTQLNQATDEIKTKKMEIESKERIEMAKLKVQLELKMAEMGSKEALSLLGHEINSIKERMQILDIDLPVDQDQSHLNQDFNQMPPDQSAPGFEQQPPTGGLTPGQFMEE